MTSLNNLQVVNTLLPTPGAPRINVASGKPTVANTGVWDTRVRVRWDAAAGTTSTSIGGDGMVAGGGSGAAGGGGTATDRAATKILMQVRTARSRVNGGWGGGGKGWGGCPRFHAPPWSSDPRRKGRGGYGFDARDTCAGVSPFMHE